MKTIRRTREKRKFKGSIMSRSSRTHNSILVARKSCWNHPHLCCWIALLGLFVLVAEGRLASDHNSHHHWDPRLLQKTQECSAIGKCEMCTFTDLQAIPACKETSRMQQFKCVTLDDSGNEVEKKKEIRSCAFTEADEEFAMIRLEMFCLLIGSMAAMSVRRQKRFNTSLFDQRKRAANERNKGKRRGSDFHNEEEEIEFTNMNNNSETVPLVENSSNPLEVI